MTAIVYLRQLVCRHSLTAYLLEYPERPEDIGIDIICTRCLKHVSVDQVKRVKSQSSTGAYYRYPRASFSKK